MPIAIIGALLLMMFGCTSPEAFTKTAMHRYDSNTEYAVDPLADGFAISISYTRYQFVPESDALSVACRSALTSLAYKHSEGQGRKIKPINEQQIQMSFGRNGLSGISSCTATATASWVR